MTSATPAPITQLELIALQRLYLDARYRGDSVAAPAIKALFEQRAREYAVGRPLADLMRAIDQDGEGYDLWVASLDDPPPAPPAECVAPSLSGRARAQWLRAYMQDGAGWTDDEILMAMGMGMN
ncbi:hypothetical protein [Demequina gelatinilytica]|uniref:hypothetical protein n=1 Tax=Demequina gelatinilytica TaxID=1638980 RepID=UPI00078675C9|nr:hypothetical protein [Demequina gelatinilytica]